MDSKYSLQDVLRCHLCETPVLQMYCYVCDKNMCSACEEEHLSDLSRVHKVVPFKFRRSFPKCQKHSLNICELLCEQCVILICEYCSSSKEHKGHKFIDVLENLENQTNVLQNDLRELEKSIYPNYQEIASSIPIQKSDMKENSQKLTTATCGNNHEEDYEDLNVPNKQEIEIRKAISEIEQCTADLNKLMTSNDTILIFAYNSRNADFKEQFDSLSALFIKTEKHGYRTDSQAAESSYPDRPLIDEPYVISDIKTKYRVSSKLLGVCCLNDGQIWTCGYNDRTMRLYNLRGELVQSVQTKSGSMWDSQWDIALTSIQKI